MHLFQILELIKEHSYDWFNVKERGAHLDSYRQAEFARPMQILLEDIYNHQGYNVIQYATYVGSDKFICHIYNMDGIYRFFDQKTQTYEFDVTNLTPETSDERRNGKRRLNNGCCCSCCELDCSYADDDDANDDDSDTDDDDDGTNQSQVEDEQSNKVQKQSQKSCLDIIIDNEDDSSGTRMLDASPIKYLIFDYWAIYRFVYVTGLVIHLINMVALSTVPVRHSRSLWQDSNETTDDSQTSNDYLLFLLWPLVLLLLYAVVILVKFRYIFRCDVHRHTFLECVAVPKVLSGPLNYMADACCEPKTAWLFVRLFADCLVAIMGLLYNILRFASRNFTAVMGLAYFCLVARWLTLYQEKDESQVYFLAGALVVGWLYCITFLRAFESVNVFIIMFKHIIVKDLLPISLVFLCFLLGFGTALNILFRMSPTMHELYPSLWHVLYATFTLTIGLEEIISEDTNEQYRAINSHSGYLRFTVLFYVVFSTIILLNILIAKMSDTYTEVRETEGTNWRVISVRQAIKLERGIPLLGRMSRDMRRRSLKTYFEQSVKQAGSHRCFKTVPIAEEKLKLSDVKSDLTFHVSKMENRLINMERQNKKLLDKIESALKK